MESLLFLAHRIPYPPNKGDKIRSFNLLKHLAKDYRIYLGAFVDDADDWRYERILRDLCADVCLIGIRPKLRRLHSLSALLRGDPLSLAYYFDGRLRRWVSSTIRKQGIDRVLVFSSPMAQYVCQTGPEAQTRPLRRVVDFVDVDSEKWRQYSTRHRWPMSWVYAREGRKLLRYDRRVAEQCEVSVFVSDAEARVFRDLAPESADRVTYVTNGVDTDYFSPDRSYENPYADGDKVLVFTGAMDYWANVDAVRWFCTYIFPALRRACPAARCYIVGARPTEAVRRLAEVNGVEVTGSVSDIRPYLYHAVAAIAPLRIARGLQNKVLEALAMAKPVLATQAAFDGIRMVPALRPLISDEPEAWSRRGTALLLDGDRDGIGAAGRRLVQEAYCWAHHLHHFEVILEGRSPAVEEAAPGVGAVS